MRRLLIATLVLLAFTACTKPPYQKPQTQAAELSADYQDCYSLGALRHYTPGETIEVRDATSACMQKRGYKPACMVW